MSAGKVDDKLFDYLVSNVSGERFESLAKRLFSVMYGEEYVPLGGMHDGGADGYYLSRVSAAKKPTVFFQFSVMDQSRAKEKISKTIEALKRAGREPKQIIYSTVENLPKQDLLATDIFDKYEVSVVIRDRDRLRMFVNSDPKANREFLDFFRPEIDALRNSAKSLQGSVNQFVQDPTVFAFLDYELKDRFSKDHLYARILDSLIYWSLRDTDPDAEKFLARSAVVEAIQSVFPNAAGVLLPQLSSRLKELSKKLIGEAERVRHHKKSGADLYCLPFAMRKELAERAVAETRLQEDFLRSITDRLKSVSNEPLSNNLLEIGGRIIFDSVHQYFVDQGLVLAAFLGNKVETVNFADQIVENEVARVVANSTNKSTISPSLIGDSMQVLRGVFYDPTDLERQYLSYLSRTSLLYMTVQAAPRMIEYFNQMTGNFRLFVGTDILVKAISEQKLPPERRQVESLLRACVNLGSELVLAEPVLNEVFTHLHAVDQEYRHHYLPNEAYLSPTEVSECDRILIRAYYYARFSQKTKIGWDAFINNLLDPSELRSKSEKGRNQLRGLLLQQFGMTFLSDEDIRAGVDIGGMQALADRLKAVRTYKREELSDNDALMAYAVYAYRRRNKESAIYDGFGFRTWWLTKETEILNHTGALVAKESGVPYIMRPEFILNFIVLAPNAAHVRKAFRELLPTTVGLQLGQHLRPEVMHELLNGTQEWAELRPERVSVMIGDRVNKLKFDRYKQYVTKV